MSASAALHLPAVFPFVQCVRACAPVTVSVCARRGAGEVLTYSADRITWADYWSAQKPGSSGSFSSFYTKYSCCQRLGSSDEAWAGAKDCVCRPYVKYRTVHACGLKAACSAADRDIKEAKARISDFTNKPVTQQCTSALYDALCSYHFWGCSGDYPEVVYNNVCLDVCTALETSCR